MRSRNEIEKTRRHTAIAGRSSEMERLLLEVLLDIRDLLTPKPVTLSQPPNPVEVDRQIYGDGK